MSDSSPTLRPQPDEETIAFAGRVFQLARDGGAEQMRSLLAQGLPPNLRNDKGDTLLMLAAYHLRTDTVRALLEGGANPEIANLPGWVVGLIAAGAIAAALSTAAGLLLAISSAISHDLIKTLINPKISEKNEMMAARISMACAILLATYLGLNPPGFAAQVVALAFGIAAATLFPVLMMGIFSKRMNDKGAICGMVAGLVITLLYIFTYLGWFFIPETNMLPNTPDQWFMGISPASFGSVGALINFAVAYAVSMVTAEPPQEIQDLVESVRTPKGAGAALSH